MFNEAKRAYSINAGFKTEQYYGFIYFSKKHFLYLLHFPCFIFNHTNTSHQKILTQLEENWTFVYFCGKFCQVMVKLTGFGHVLCIQRNPNCCQSKMMGVWYNARNLVVFLKVCLDLS